MMSLYSDFMKPGHAAGRRLLPPCFLLCIDACQQTDDSQSADDVLFGASWSHV